MSFFSASGGMSKREGAKFQTDLRKSLEADARKKYRKKLDELDAELELVKAAGRAKVAAQRERCSAEVKDTRATARADAKQASNACREVAREEMRQRSRACSLDARAKASAKVEQKKNACSVEGREVREQVRTEAQIVADKKQAEKDFAAEMRRIESTNASRDKERSKKARGESVKEKIEALVDEIERSAPHLMPYWRKVRNKAAFVQETGRRSAFERLVEQAAEDSEAGAAAEDAADDFVRQLEREQHGRGSGRKRGRPNLKDVPF